MPSIEAQLLTPYSEDYLNRIFESNDGRCCYCGKKLVFKNYGKMEERGNWELAHVVSRRFPIAEELMAFIFDRLMNLGPACISCNRGDRRARLWIAKLGGLIFDGTRTEDAFRWDHKKKKFGWQD